MAATGLGADVKTNTWIIQGLAFAGIALKGGLSFMVTKDFRYEKAAYELAVLVVGGVLTCLAVQITSQQDMFPGLESISFLQSMSSMGIGVVGQHVTVLFLLFVASLVGMVFAAINVADVDDGKVSWSWTLAMYGLGNVLLGAYALVLVAKG
jgi:hypothetical protein